MFAWSNAAIMQTYAEWYLKFRKLLRIDPQYIDYSDFKFVIIWSYYLLAMGYELHSLRDTANPLRVYFERPP